MSIRTQIFRTLAIAGVAAVLIGTSASAETAAPTTVTVVVAIPTPAGLSRAAVEQGIQKAIPTYRTVPGLLRKYFTVGDHDFGGVYLFNSRAAADAWFNEAWSKRVVATYGAPASVTYYDVPVVLDNVAVPVASQAK